MVRDINAAGDFIVGGDFHDHSPNDSYLIRELSDDGLDIEGALRLRTLRALSSARYAKAAVIIAFGVALICLTGAFYLRDGSVDIASILSGASSAATIYFAIAQYGSRTLDERRQLEALEEIRQLRVDRRRRR